MHKLLVRSVLVVFLGAIAAPVFAQQGTAEIGGRVADEQGGVLPGVTIVLTNEETGVFREVASGEDGSYFASQLTPGRRSFEVLFPQDTVDPGPSRGQFPTDPTLVNGPVINLAYINALYPPGTLLRNTGDLMFDKPDRKQPMSAGSGWLRTPERINMTR
jgi:hypothetical protein